MTARLMLVSEPLPECSLCDTPTKRAAWEANGGLCTPCTDSIADINHHLTQSADIAADRPLRPLYPADDQ